MAQNNTTRRNGKSIAPIGFTRIDNRAVDMLSKKVISKTNFVVLAVICARANGATGKCWPSYQKLADDCGCHRSTVIRSIRVLESCQLIGIERNVGRSNHITVSWSSTSDTGSVGDTGSTSATSTSSTSATPGVAPVRPKQEPENKNHGTRTNKRVRSKEKRVLIDLADITFPDGMDTPEVRTALGEWLSYKRDRHQAYKSTASISKLLAQFHRRDGAEAVTNFAADVDAAMANNWNGCFFSDRGAGVSRNGRQPVVGDYS